MTQLRSQLAMELWVLRPYARQFVILVALGGLFVFLLDTAVPLMMVMAVLTGSYGFAITEGAHLETLFASLPSPRRNVVLARYGVATGILLASGLAGLAIDAVAAPVRQQAWSAPTAFSVLASTFAVAALVMAIQFPFFFALGYTRARIVTYVTIASIGALVGLFAALAANPASWLDWLTATASAPSLAIVPVGLLTGLLALTASAAISVRLYNRKDL